jgi:hypothetical protein
LRISRYRLACAPDHCQVAFFQVCLAPMKQSQTQQLEEMHATLARAVASLENHNDTETHRLLALLRGCLRVPLPRRNTADGGADHSRAKLGRAESQRNAIQRTAVASANPMIATMSTKTTP